MAKNDGWEDVPEVASSDGWEDVAPTEDTSKKPYSVDLKSKKALAKNQIEMLKRNPDFKAMSKIQQAELLGQTEAGLVNPYEDTNIFKEGAQFAGETGLAMVNAAKKVGTDVGTLGRYAYGVGKGLLPGNDYATEEYKGLQAANQMQKDYKPWEMPKEYGQSVTGQKIGEAFQAGEEGLSRLTGEYLDNPELGKQIAGVGMNTMMFAPVAKGVMKRTAAVGPTETGAALKPQSGFGAGFTEPSPLSSAVRGTADLALRAIDKVPYMSDTSLYTQALKTGSSTSAKGQANRAKAIETGLNEGIIISPSGEAILGKGVKDIINDTFGDEGGLWQQGEAIVKSPEFAKTRIDLGVIEERAKASASELAAGGREASRAAVEKVISEMKEHPSYDPKTNTISGEASYREKQKLYRALDKAYEQDTLAGMKDAQTNIAAELRQVTGDIIPELKGILAKEGENINFIKYGKRRMESMNTGGLLGGSSLGLMINAPRAIALRIIQSPGFKSRLAIAIRAAKKRNVTNAEVNSHVNSIVEAMSKSPEEQKQLQAPAGAVEGEYIPPNRQQPVQPQTVNGQIVPEGQIGYTPNFETKPYQGEVIQPKAEAPVAPEAPIIEGQRPIAGEIGYTPNFVEAPLKQLPEQTPMIAGEKGGVFNPSTPQAPGMTKAEIARAAKKIGVPVAAVTAYLMADDETKNKMKTAMPMIGMLGVYKNYKPGTHSWIEKAKPNHSWIKSEADFPSIESYGMNMDSTIAKSASSKPFLQSNIYNNIGSGEGQQRYTPGLYSATDAPTHQFYLNQFGPSGIEKFEGKVASPISKQFPNVSKLVTERDMLQKRLDSLKSKKASPEVTRIIYDKLNDVVSKIAKEYNKHYTPKEAISHTLDKPPIDTYFDYQVPIKDQPKYVQDRMLSIPGVTKDMMGYIAYEKLAELTKNKTKASQYLDSIGISGTKYKTQESNGYNFVDYGDRNIDVIDIK